MEYELGKTFNIAIVQRGELPPFEYPIPNEQTNTFLLESMPRRAFTRNKYKEDDIDTQ